MNGVDGAKKLTFSQTTIELNTLSFIRLPPELKILLFISEFDLSTFPCTPSVYQDAYLPEPL
jgi:hypothetical protein